MSSLTFDLLSFYLKSWVNQYRNVSVHIGRQKFLALFLCKPIKKIPSFSFSRSYFESGVCSVYLWDLDHGFAGVVLIKKAGDTERIKGCWDSIHVVEVQVREGRVCERGGCERGEGVWEGEDVREGRVWEESSTWSGIFSLSCSPLPFLPHPLHPFSPLSLPLHIRRKHRAAMHTTS